jgi:hypothetical protein
MQNARETRTAALAASACLILLAGCASGGAPLIVPNATGTLASFPSPPAATPQNTYTGTDSLQQWTLNIDDTAHTWSYSETTDLVTDSNKVPLPLQSASSGTLTAVSGFQSLGSAADGTSLGLMLETQGRFALLRPGGSGSGLVIAVPQTTCYILPAKQRLEYLNLDAYPNGLNTDPNGHPLSSGSVVVSTSPDGSKWHYEALEGATALGPANFDGTCASSSGEAFLSIPNSSLLNSINNGQNTLFSNFYGSTNPIRTSLTIGPSGIVVARQAQDGSTPAAVAGFAEPPAPLSSSNILTGSYLGFQSLSIVTGFTQNTVTPFRYGGASPISFVPDSTGKLLTGGIFQNDDPAQATLGDTTISLGSQSTTLNGYYPSAKVTRPDPNQFCLILLPSGAGVNAFGTPTCTFPAVAVAGQTDGKYAIFLNAHDFTVGSYTTRQGSSLQIYLYQQ